MTPELTKRIAAMSPDQFESFLVSMKQLHQYLNIQLETEGTDEMRARAAETQRRFDENAIAWRAFINKTNKENNHAEV